MRNEPLILIAPSDRVLIIGTSGSGKSWLTRRVLVPAYAVNPVVLDPKERWETRDARIVKHFRRGSAYQTIRLPDYADQDGPELWDREVQAAMRDRIPHTLIVDELTLVTRAQQLPPGLRRALHTGRDTKRGAFGLWMLTQRPAYIPTSCYALANHKFFFMVENDREIEKICDQTTPALAPYLQDLHIGDYVYYNRERALIIPVTRHRPGAAS